MNEDNKKTQRLKAALIFMSAVETNTLHKPEGIFLEQKEQLEEMRIARESKTKKFTIELN